jgi:hypothetical protein
MDVTAALQSLKPGASWYLNGDTYEGLSWLDKTQTKPTEEEINKEIERLRVEHQRIQYQRDRKLEYPSIGDQLDALFHAGVFPPEMAAQIQSVKDKYPKPE